MKTNNLIFSCFLIITLSLNSCNESTIDRSEEMSKIQEAENGPPKRKVKCWQDMIYNDKSNVINNTYKIDSLEVSREILITPLSWKCANEACEILGDGWRLPTMAELQIMYNNRIRINFEGGDFIFYWSSEIVEYPYDKDQADFYHDEYKWANKHHAFLADGSDLYCSSDVKNSNRLNVRVVRSCQ